MSEQLLSGESPGEEHKDGPGAESAQGSYTLTEEDERELAIVRKQLQALEQRLGKLDHNAHLDGLKEHFPLGTGGNRRSGGWQNRKRFEASFDKAKRLAPLYEEHLRLLAQVEALLTGARAREREREAARKKEREEAAERVRHAHAGDYMYDSSYGTVRVVRVNAQSLTIVTETGRREARKFSLIEDRAFTEDEITVWFVKRDAAGTFPIRAFVGEALAGGKSIEEVIIWLRDETYRRYPLLIRNLPWQKIAQHFYGDGGRTVAQDVAPDGTGTK